MSTVQLNALPPVWFHYGAVVLSSVSLILIAVATGTTSWVEMKASYHHNTATEVVGLFQFCLFTDVETCDSVIVDGGGNQVVCGTRTISQVNSMLRSIQACAVISTLLAGAAVFFCPFRMLFQSRITLILGAGLVETFLSGAASVFALLTWALFAYFMRSWYVCGTSYCDELQRELSSHVDTFQCGFDYSFILCIIAWLLLALSSGAFFAGFFFHQRAATRAAEEARHRNYSELIQE